MNAYWRAANYLSVGQIYLYENPLLREPLKLSHVKPLVVGHWGTTPDQNLVMDVIDRMPQTGIKGCLSQAGASRQALRAQTAH
jgi:phosphoketolase